jgi:hypothetical protein
MRNTSGQVSAQPRWLGARVATALLLVVGTIMAPSASTSLALDPLGTVSTVAGGGFGDGGQANNAMLRSPDGVAVDTAGNVYIADSSDSRIRKVDAMTGVITTIAGTGTYGYAGDGGPATSAQLSYPRGVAVDTAGNIYIADQGDSRIRKITVSSGVITTIAGTGAAGYNGDGGQATNAQLNRPSGVAVDAFGNVYIADLDNDRVRKVDAITGLITTIAGTGTDGYNGDNITATAAQLRNPIGVAVDALGDIYIADSGNDRIRKVTVSSGDITTIAGDGTDGDGGDGGPATSAQLRSASGVAVDSFGDIYIADQTHSIRKVTVSSGVITTIAGDGTDGYAGDGSPATDAQLNYPNGVAVDTAFNIYIADTGNSRIRKITGSSGVITTFAGGGIGDGGQATDAPLYDPNGVAVDTAGNIYIADYGNSSVRKVDAITAVITTIAGTGTDGYGGDGGQATSAQLNRPSGVAVDTAGNIYIADYGNSRVRKVDAITGVITTIAGTGTSGYGGDGGPATNAPLRDPRGVAVDTAFNIYIADTGNSRIRMITGSSGVITTIAGTGVDGYNGDNITATTARLNYPSGVAVDTAGSIYIADSDNDRIRKVTGSPGVITTIAGTGAPGYNGDGGQATSARLNDPRGVAVDTAGDIYIADFFNHRIRKITGSPGVITTIAGDGTSGYGGDGGPATSAQLSNPIGVAVDPAGNLYIADNNNNRIRKVRLATPPSRLVPLASRLFDTRPGTAAGAIAVPKQLVAGGSFLEVQLTGNAGIPGSGVGSVVLNVTAVDPTADGFITVYPCGTRPGTSNLNFTSGQTVANTVITPVSAAGKVCFYADGTTHLIADLSRWFPAGQGLNSSGASRLFDTRPGTAAGVIAVPKQLVAGGSFLEVQLTGNAGIPGSGVGSVVLNVTAVDPTAGGFITVYPCGTRPATSNLNFTSGQTVANTVITPVSAAGKVCFYADGTTHLIADLSGWFPTGQGPTSSGASRLFDTRPGTAAGAIAVPKQLVAGGSFLEVQLTGNAGVPGSGVGSVVLNVTAVDPTAGGFITVYPCGTRPATSNLNFTSGQTVANTVITPVSAAGKVCFYADGTTHLIADLSGWFPT